MQSSGDIGSRKASSPAQPLTSLETPQKRQTTSIPKPSAVNLESSANAKNDLQGRVTANANNGKVNEVADKTLPKPEPALNAFQKFVNWGVKKAINFAKGDYSFDQMNEKSKARLAELTGNAEMGTVLSILTPKLGEIVLDALKQKAQGLGNGVAAAVGEQQELVTQSLEATLLNMMVNLGDYTQVQGQSQNVSCFQMLSKLLGVAEKHLKDLHKEMAELQSKSLSEAEKKEHLKKILVPFQNEIMKMLMPNGEKDICLPPGHIMDKVRSKIYEGVNDIFPDLIVEYYLALKVDQKAIREEFSEKDVVALENASKGISEGIVNSLKEKVVNNNEAVLKFINERLPVDKLTKPQQDWLASEIQNAGFTLEIQEVVNYIQSYAQNLIFNSLGHLARQYKLEHKADYEVMENRDFIKLASLQLLSVLTSNLESLHSNKDLINQIKAAQKLPFNQKKEKLRELSAQIQPYLLNLLGAIGFKQPTDLAIPDPFRNTVWEKVTSSVLPELLINYMSDALVLQPSKPSEMEGLQNAEKAQLTIATLASNALPMVQKMVGEKKESLAVSIQSNINKVMPNAVSPETIQELLNEFVLSKEAAFKKLNHLVPNLITDYLTPLILNLASANDGSEGDVLKQTVSNLLTIINVHFEDREAFDAQLIGFDQLSDTEKQSKLDEVFRPFLGDMLNRAGIDITACSPSLLKVLFSQTYNLYKVLKSPVEIQQNTRLDLLKVFGLDIAQLQEGVNKHSESVRKEALPLEGAFNFISQTINEKVNEFLVSKASVFVSALNDRLPKQKLSETDQKWMESAIKGVAESKDPSINSLRTYTETVIKTALMKLFVNVAKQSSDANDPKTLFPSILKKISEVLGGDLEGIQAKIKKIHQEQKDPTIRKNEIRKLFIPLSQELLKLAGNDPFEGLPVPANIRGPLLSYIQESLLPDVVGDLYLDLAKWSLKSKGDQAILMELFVDKNPKNPMAAARVAARFATDMIPVFINNPDKEIAKKAQSFLTEFMLKQSPEKVETIQKYLNENPKDFIQFVNENMQLLLDPNFGFKDATMPTLEHILETSILKFMSKVFTKVNERQNPEFILDVGVNIIQIANNHLKEILRIMELKHKKRAFDIKPDEMRKEFGKGENEKISGKNGRGRELHAALQLDPNIEPDEQAMNHFFKPITESFLKLAGLEKPEDFPFPSPVREQLFEMVKTQLGPKLLQEVLNTINIDKTVLAILEMVNKKMADPKFEVTETDEELKLTPEEKAKRDKIDKECGELFLNLVQLIPNTALRAFFSSDKIRNLSAQSLGRVLRTQLLKVNLLDLINEGMIAGLTSLNKQIKKDERGNLIVPDDLHFEFPKVDKIKIEAERHEVKLKLIRELTKTLRDQILTRIKEFFRGPWRKIQKKMDTFIEQKFGRFGKEVKKFLDKIFHFVVFTCLGFLVQLAAYPLIKLLGLILNKHLTKKSADITETLHMDIHKNLVFNVSEYILEAFNKGVAATSK